MAKKIDAWMDINGKLHPTEEGAVRADQYYEIMNGFNRAYDHSSSKAILLDYILNRYNLTPKYKK